MRKISWAIAGFIFGITSAWVVMNARSHDQFRQAKMDADLRVAAIQKELSVKNDEIAVLGAHNVELSRRAQDRQKQIEQLSSHSLPAASSPPKEGNPFSQFFSSDFMKTATRNHLDAKLANLKTRLKLTDSQIGELNAAIQREVDTSAKTSFDGQPVITNAVGSTGPGFEETLKKTLTPEQQQEYKSYQAEEKSNQIEMVANAELMQLQMAVSLSEEQKDKAFQAFSQEAQRMTDPRSYQAGGTMDPSALIDQQMQHKKEALRGILTPEQFSIYEKQLAAQQEMAKKILQNFKPTTSSPSAK